MKKWLLVFFLFVVFPVNGMDTESEGTDHAKVPLKKTTSLRSLTAGMTPEEKKNLEDIQKKIKKAQERKKKANKEG